MLGQIIKGGTGECDILLDEEMILNNEFEDENIKDKENTKSDDDSNIKKDKFKTLEEEFEINDCNDLNFDMDFNFQDSVRYSNINLEKTEVTVI